MVPTHPRPSATPPHYVERGLQGIFLALSTLALSLVEVWWGGALAAGAACGGVG
jgi:hypothetical protein